MQTNDEITAAAMRVKAALDEFNALVLASISNGMGKSIEVSSPVDQRRKLLKPLVTLSCQVAKEYSVAP